MSAAPSEPQLVRVSYHSEKTNAERDYFVYLPRGYNERASWPVLMFLHGDGERGDGKGELDYVLAHGPLFEAWCQKRDLPFIIIVPQLPMYDRGEIPYIKSRKPSDIPQRRAEGLNPIPWHAHPTIPMDGQPAVVPTREIEHDPVGWNTLETELLGMIDTVLARYHGDPHRVYLTGLSYGGYGTWFMAAHHPERFAAIAPVVGYGLPSMAPPLAAAKMPIWVFAGGRDQGEPPKYFYPLLNELERLGHTEVRFTIEADMAHDTWIRVYGGNDLYDWFLSHQR